MATNTVIVNVRDHHKTLRFSELITTGSIYSLTVDGASIPSGAIFITGNDCGEEKLVAYATITSNAATLSTNTAELKAAMANLPIGAMRSFFCVIHKDGAGEYENVATGTVNISNAGGTWSDTTTGAAILYKGPKGDKGDKPVITASKVGGTTTIYADGVAIATVLDGSGGAPKPTAVVSLAADSTMNQVISKINELLRVLKS